MKAISKKKSIIGAIDSGLKLLALFAFLIESVLIGGAFLMERGWDRTILFIGALFLFLIMIVFIGIRLLKGEAIPERIKAIWGDDDIPLTDDVANLWRGEWNAKWTYRDGDNELKRYVDDKISIETINLNTGEFTGYGVSSYEENRRYNISGRISKKGFCHFFYSSHSGYNLSGVSILKASPMGDITGWWLGAGRKGGDIGGDVELIKSYPNDGFEIKTYNFN